MARRRARHTVAALSETLTPFPRFGAKRARPSRLRIAMLAPPWIPLPPAGYGGIEAVVALLTDALVARGHDVTLFAAPGSRSTARVRPLLEEAHPDVIGAALHEADHVGAAFDAIDAAAARGRPFDLVHDHSGFTAIAMAPRLCIPMVHTLHGDLAGETAGFFRRHARGRVLVAISATQAATLPPGVDAAAVVTNPIDVDAWPLVAEKDDYLLWVGRMDPVKGPHRAIVAARRAGRRLVLAGPVQPGQEAFFAEQVEPHIDGDRVRYAGEIGGPVKQRLFARAAALLMPIRWPEPFGMVMIEALACGTPVIAFPEGAARDIVVDGVNGRLVADEAEMATAVAQIDRIDPVACRRAARERHDVRICVDGYEAVYRALIAAQPGPVPVAVTS